MIKIVAYKLIPVGDHFSTISLMRGFAIWKFFELNIVDASYKYMCTSAPRSGELGQTF